jgi:hypothetical protein
MTAVPMLSDQLERWLTAEGAQKTLGGLIDTFGEKSFAILVVFLLAVPALPLPTGGATHVFEAIAVLLALQLIGGRREVWLPARWRGLSLAGPRQQRFVSGLLRLIRRLERFSRPRLSFLFRRRPIEIAFAIVIIAGSAGAFFAPPFSGLDTLPSFGVLILALGFLLEDFAVAGAGAVLCGVGIGLELAVGAAAVHGLQALL